MKAVCLILLLSITTGCLADDQDQRIREAEEIAARDVDKWEAAVAAKDAKAQAGLLEDVLYVLWEAELQSVKLGSISTPVISLVKTIADARCPAFMRNRILKQITKLMSKSKDNLVYYRLDAIKQWIERRPDTEHDADLQQILQDVTDAREAVNDLGHGVGGGVLAMKDETSKSRPDQERVRQLAAEMVQAQEQHAKELFAKLEATRTGIESLQQKLRQ